MKSDKVLSEQFFYLIEKVNKLTRRHAEEVLLQRGFDVTIDQWLTLKKIHDEEAVSQNEIAEALFKDKASITRIIQILVRKKLIVREGSDDKRVNHIKLSGTGKDMVKKMLPHIINVRKEVLKDVPVNDLQVVQYTLQKMINTLQ